MSYDNNFYKAYQTYLGESIVRRQHGWIFSLLGDEFLKVIDLGCGQFNEFRRYHLPTLYSGIDIQPETLYKNVIAGNYRDHKVLLSVANRVLHTSFVSLFSSEITAPYATNYNLYNWIFKKFPNIQSGLVSGFYYESKKDQNPIGETGGIISYQTLESIEDGNRKGYSEKRIILPVPSNLFGKDVFEVWKLFERS